MQAYAAWLGFYNSAKGMGWDKPTLVQQANRFAGGPGQATWPWPVGAAAMGCNAFIRLSTCLWPGGIHGGAGAQTQMAK